MITAAVLAGGTGTRLGGNIPKQFLPIGGVPVIVRSIEKFLLCKKIHNIIVAVSPDFVAYTKELIDRHLPHRSNIIVVPGGQTRSETLLCVLEALEKNGISSEDIILTHDAVRPFITEEIIENNISAAIEFGACNTCIPATDTVFISSDGEFITAVPERKTVFHAQTPQSFRTKELLELCRSLPLDVFNSLSDGCSVYTYFGKKVKTVIGSTLNIKITYPEDIEKAELILKGETK